MYIRLCLMDLDTELEFYRVRFSSFLNRSSPFGVFLCEVNQAGDELHLIFHLQDHDLLFLEHFHCFCYRIEQIDENEIALPYLF